MKGAYYKLMHTMDNTISIIYKLKQYFSSIMFMIYLWDILHDISS